MQFFKILWQVVKSILIVALLTVVTQVGGVIYLLTKPLALKVQKKFSGWNGVLLRYTTYLMVYLLTSIFILPVLARQYNRTPLPYFTSEEVPIKPASWFYCFANRHYVRTDLLQCITTVSKKTNTRYPGTKIMYLDANFPLLEYFPLLPHRSHNDGRRLDISFLYLNKDGKRLHQPPVWLGYGYCENPKKGEVNWPESCRKKGYKLYNMLYNTTKSLHSDHHLFDHEANRFLLKEIVKQKAVRKVFIEPHLKRRLNLQAEGKIRFHGCAAVRHDDHIHLEL